MLNKTLISLALSAAFSASLEQGEDSLVLGKDTINLLTPTELQTLVSDGMTGELMTVLSSLNKVYVDLSNLAEAYEALKVLNGVGKVDCHDYFNDLDLAGLKELID